LPPRQCIIVDSEWTNADASFITWEMGEQIVQGKRDIAGTGTGLVLLTTRKLDKQMKDLLLDNG
jgi:hypothetical protein